MAGASAAAIAVALDIILRGVDWSPKWGAICPRCGKKKCDVTRTMKWEGNTRIRYHKCKYCKKSFKSLETNYKTHNIYNE